MGTLPDLAHARPESLALTRPRAKLAGRNDEPPDHREISGLTAQIRKVMGLSKSTTGMTRGGNQSVAFLNPWLTYAAIGGIVRFLY